MSKEMKIVPPEGYEIDTENSTFECIKFKKIEKSLPKTWKEFCELKPHAVGEYYLMGDVVYDVTNSSYVRGKEILPNKETAEAMLALCQLIQLRDCYNDGWVPDWRDRENKWVIYVYASVVMSSSNLCVFDNHQKILVFRTAELRDQFLENFRELIEIAKPLL